MEREFSFANLPPQDVLSALNRCLPDLVFIVDEDGRYQAILGGSDRRRYHDPGHLLGRRFHDVMPKPLADQLLDETRNAIETGRTHTFRYSLSASDVEGYSAQAGPSAPQWFEARVRVIPNAVGKRHAVATVFNITERIHTETMLKRLAYTDDLTGLPNRRAFRRTGRSLLLETRSSGRLLAVALIDIDHFKRINDSYGHKAGDAALRSFASMLVGKTRDGDYLARVGGEEFAFLLPDTSLLQAKSFLERVKRDMSAVRFSCDDRDVKLSFSAGVFADSDSAPASVDALLKSADKALYSAKSNGRDRVECLPTIS